MAPNYSQAFLDPKFISRDPNLLYPKFWAKLRAGLVAAQSAGHKVTMFEGWRSHIRQASLYDKSYGMAVTHANGWESWHQYGLAADLAFNDGDWNWKGDFEALKPYFEAQGLRWGGAQDSGHWEWPCAISHSEAFKLSQAAGVQAVWQAI